MLRPRLQGSRRARLAGRRVLKALHKRGHRHVRIGLVSRPVLLRAAPTAPKNAQCRAKGPALPDERPSTLRHACRQKVCTRLTAHLPDDMQTSGQAPNNSSVLLLPSRCLCPGRPPQARAGGRGADRVSVRAAWSFTELTSCRKSGMALRSGHRKPIDSKKGTTPVRGPEYTTCPAREGIGRVGVRSRVCSQDHFQNSIDVVCVGER
jgi:hypothetical protein